MKAWFRNSFLLALALLVIAEAVVRVFFARNMSGRFDYGYHPTAGFVEKAAGTIDLVRAGGRRFRPQSFSQTRPPGTFRIMVVGDSVPRGPSLQGAYIWQVGEMLRSRGIQTESLNLAVPGFGAHRDYLVFRKALDYQPNLIILHVNRSNEYEDEREFRRSQEFKSWHPKNWLMKSLVIRRLYEAKTEKVFWELLPAEVRMGKAVNDADAEILAGMNADTQRRWDERVRQYTTEDIALARAKGVPVLLVMQAFNEKDKVGHHTLNSHELDALGKSQSLTGNGVYYLSMKDVFGSLDYASLFADTSHIHAEGHKMLAKAIVKKLLAEGVVQPADK